MPPSWKKNSKIPIRRALWKGCLFRRKKKLLKFYHSARRECFSCNVFFFFEQKIRSNPCPLGRVCTFDNRIRIEFLFFFFHWIVFSSRSSQKTRRVFAILTHRCNIAMLGIDIPSSFFFFSLFVIRSYRSQRPFRCFNSISKNPKLLCYSSLQCSNDHGKLCKTTSEILTSKTRETGTLTLVRGWALTS